MLNAQDLIEVRKIMAAATLIGQGAFKKELDEIAAASAELDKKLGVVKTVEQVEARRVEIAGELEARERKVAAVEAELATRIATVKEAAENLAANMAAHEGKVSELTSREALVVSGESKLAADIETFNAMKRKVTAEQDERQQRLVDRENKLRAGEQALKDRIAAMAKAVGA
jgi:chromosome segregation ATPase